MPERSSRRIDVDGASAVFEALPLPVRPSTLHPRYVAADARRDATLEPLFFLFESQGERWLHGLQVSRIDGTGWKDASSPYGYGGPVASTADRAFADAAFAAYSDWMRGESVVAEYTRFHPLLGNDACYGGNIADNREVVCVDLRAEDVMDQYAPRVRQTVVKGIKAGLVYEEVPLASAWRDFGEFHRAAMREMGTDSFFLFGDAYFESLAGVPRAVVAACRAEPGGAWLGAAVFLDGRDVREYHLAGTNAAGRKAGASTWLLHRAALAARNLGIQRLYLGGGSDPRADNPLLFFKQGFSQQRLTYRTGSTIFDAAAHDELKSRYAQQWQAHPERPIFWRKV
jgi:hypothetical protein